MNTYLKPTAFSPRWRSLRAALLTSTALLPSLISHQAQARSLTPGNSSVAPATAAQLAAGLAAQQAAAAGAQAQVSLARAAAALNAARQAQQDAAAAGAQALKSTVDGVVTNGLMPLGGVKDVTAQSACGDSCSTLQLNTPTSWQNANTTFTETAKNGQYKVDITQTQSRAILNWETFNIGRNTSVKFEQQSSDWIVLNRVTDPSGSPTQILGQMSALGGVYVINRNGIIFGAGAQVNVHALVASSLDVGALGLTQDKRDTYFINTGINGANVTAFSVAPTRSPPVPGTPDDGSYTAENNSWGDVKINAGASISASTVGLDNTAFIYLFGRNVSNSGTLTAPGAEVALVTARTIDLVAGGYWKLPSNVLPSNATGDVTYRGTDFKLTQFASKYAFGSGIPLTTTYVPGTGIVTNDGLIETPRGVTQMNGDRITIGQGGVISADTGITRNSMVLLRAATSVDLEGTISALAYDDPLAKSLPLGGSAGSIVQSFTPAYVELSAQGSVTVGSSGLISAPSATVALRAIDLGPTVNAQTLYTNYTQNALFLSQGNPFGLNPSVTGPQRVLLQPGATIDVAGLQNVELPASYNFIPFKPTGNEVADMPLQRSWLPAKTFWIDIRASGTRSDGTSWVGTPVADASGTINAYGRSIQQLMTTGGVVSLQTDRTATGVLITDRSVITQSGSVINVAGGNVTYLPGMVSTSVLLGADGRRYGMANADPNMTYVGLAGQFTVNHSRWGKEIWSTATEVQAPGYTEGHDAGGINVTTVSPQLQGQMYFGSMAGERQTSFGLKPSATNGVTNTQAKGDELPSQGYLTLSLASSVVIGTSADSTSGALGVTNQVGSIAGVPDPAQFAPIVKGADFTPSSAYQTVLSAATLSSYGLSLLQINSNDLLVTHNAANDAAGLPDLNLAAGGTFSATTGSAISVAGNIKAAGGQISLVTDAYTFVNGVNTHPFFQRAQTASGKADIFVEGTLDVSGRWVNDTGRFGTDMSGPGYIDGGSISIVTNKDSNGTDTTGSILLAQGSLLDASSGGYISSTGAAKTVSTGVMAGRGGSISLLTNQGSDFVDPSNGSGGPPTPSGGNVAQIQLDGTLRAYGFERNGTLTLGAAKTITIDSIAHADANSGIVTSTGGKGVTAVTLTASRLTDGGFGAYVIESTPDGWTGTEATITVAAGVDLTLQQQNLASLADYSAVGTGTNIANVAARARLPDDQRKAVDLTLKSDNVLLDTGAVIATNPQAKISFGGTPNYVVSNPTREQAAQNVLLRGSVIDHGGTVVVNAQNTWLGPQAKVDVSGTFVANSRFGQPKGQTVSGTVLGGGTFTIEAAAPNVQVGTLANTYAPGTVPSGSYVVAETGAQVDVSGYATPIQAQDGKGGSVTVASWSDAGIVKIDAAAFVWGGTFEAKGGRSADGTQVMSADGKTPVANGGTIMLGGGAMLLQQDSTNIATALFRTLAGGPATLANLASNSNSLVNQLASASGTSSSIFAAVDRLSAFENVFLYSGTAQNGAARIFTGLSGSTYGIAAPSLSPLAISGSVTWTSDNGLSRLYVAANTISSATSGSTVTLAAPYMLLTGGGGSTASITSGNSLDLRLGFDPTSVGTIARTIDVEGATFAGFNNIELKSLGDIRLSTPKVADGLTAGDAPRFTGKIQAAGADVVLDAQRIYPVSDVDFTIQTAGNVTFQASAGRRSDVPLSAGGSLSVYATTIDQHGNLFAPLGKIMLGDDGTLSGIKTTLVTLDLGSLTSVTLAGTVVPYGETLDGVNWYYNASLHPLQAASSTSEPVLPSKGLVLNGNKVHVEQGSTIDTRGGGDLQAMEWTPGKGGTRDTLAATSSGQTVYALVPSYNDPIAAYDVHFATARSLDGGQTVKAADTYPLTGQQIYLDGSSGVPAGTYTLYSGHYATLPGTWRVVDYGSNVGRNIPSGTQLPDGTVLVAGHYAQSVRQGASSSGSELFAVQSSAVWQQYSEYGFSSANRYFTDKANHDGVAIPRLPVDAGRIAVVAQQDLLLAATELNAPAAGGRGGELDISANKLAVLSPGVDPQPYTDPGAGYVVVASDQLSSFESVLIGGLRSDTAKGTLITGTASELVVDTPVDPTTRTGGISVPEIMLVTQPGTTTQQTVSSSFQVQISGNWFAGTSQFTTNAPTGTGTISIATGSVITTSGSVHTGAGRNFYVGTNPGGYTTAQQVATALGGTLDSTGTMITGADISKIPVSVPGAYGNNPSTTVLSNYYSPGLGGLFVASQDSMLSVAGPSGSPLTIQFASLAGSFPVRGADGRGGPAAVTLPGAGHVEIEAGAHISTTNLFMQATATTNSIVLNKAVPGNPNAPAATITATQAKLAGRSIGIGAGSSDGVILSQTNLDQLATVKNLTLAAVTGDITFYGSDLIQTTKQGLTLDARAVTGAGGDSRVEIGGTVTLVNTSGTTGTSAQAGLSGNLSIAATDIVFGGGIQTIAGFSQVNLAASDQLLFKSQGSLTLGIGNDAVGLQLVTPLVSVGGKTSTGGGSFVVATSGAVNIGDALADPSNPPVRANPPQDSSDTGGSLLIQGRSVSVGGFADDQGHQRSGSVIQAQAGSITLEATKGDVTLDQNAYFSARGYAKNLVDTTTYLPGGKVVLKADVGNVTTRGASDPGKRNDASVIDVAQPDGGMGYGGQIQILATAGRATVLGDLRGKGGNGLGGSILIDTNSLQVDSSRAFTPEVALNPLADKLLAGGFTGAIDIHTRTGDLILSEGHTLKANSVTLTADDQTWNSSDPTQQLGRIVIAGTIDASGYAGTTADGTGQAGGKVNLYAANEIDLLTTGVIDASTEHKDERGGDVTIGIGWGAKSNVGIDLQPGSRIDVHGGTKGGLSGGTVLIRAPNDGGNDVYITEIGSTITGARDVTIESFVSFSTNGQGGIDASSLGWNGVLDPGGSVTKTSLKVNTVYVPPGSGGSYTQVPDVIFSAPATSATGLKSISIASTSNWYHLDPNFVGEVVIEAPTGGLAASGTVTTDANGVPTFTITNAGSGFTGAPATIRFYSQGVLVTTAHTTSSDFASAQLTTTANQAQGTAVMGLKSISIASTSGWYHLDPNFSGNVVIQSASGGASATGTVTTDANGVPTFTITGAGSSFTGAPSTILFYRDGKLILTGHLTANDFASTVMTVVGVNVTNAGVGYAVGSSATLSFSGGGAGATQAASVTADMDTAAATGSGAFAAVTLRQYVQGNWTYHTNAEIQHFGLGSAMDRVVEPLAGQLRSVVHLRPGVELVNPDQNTNGGNITVASNWNLAAGTVGKLTTDNKFDPSSSYVDFVYRYLANYGSVDAPKYSVEAGALTLRAFNNINVNASISDGFFQFGDYLDTTYVGSVRTYLATSSARSIDGNANLNNYLPAPIAPYKTTGNPNGISASALDLDEADLFPHTLNVCITHCGVDSAPDGLTAITSSGSWSYRLTAGADMGSANPNAMQSLASVNGRNAGDVVVSGHVAATTIARSLNLPTMVRTGTGSISIAAARDVSLADTAAPGVIYAAGVNTARYANPYDASGKVTDANGFLEPQLLSYGSTTQGSVEMVYGAPTAAAFPVAAGDVSVIAQEDIKGYRDVTTTIITNPFTHTTATTLWNAYYTPWLIADAGVPNSAGAPTLGAGVFAPASGNAASQSAWWIQYASFREGILSAGGNVNVTAGRDLVDVSVSLPTTGRVTGGLSSLSTPQTQLYGSGNMTVRAGRNLLGGSYYEGSGHASIQVSGMVAENGTITTTRTTVVNTTVTPVTLPNYTLLAVDTGQISMVSGGSMAVGGVVNPAELHLQSSSSADPSLGKSVIMNTYGPDSGVSLTAITGNLNIAMPQTVAITNWSIGANIGVTYPASFTAVAASGDITTNGLVTNSKLTPTLPGIVLTGSERGTFELLAQGSIDLTGGFILSAVTPSAPMISAGPSLLDTAFDPYQPNNGMTGAFASSVLAHQNDHDTNPARIYAVSGDLSAVATTTSIISTGKITSAVPIGYSRVELNRPAKIYAGRDIVNLNLIAQNVAADDVTTVQAGRDILYNYGPATANAGAGGVPVVATLGGPGLQIAGPGFFVVQAGRDLGPFLPVTRDSSTFTQGQEGITSVGNAGVWPVGNRYVSQGSSGMYDLQLLGSVSATTKKRNELLPGTGADIITMFGVANGINYDGYKTTDPASGQLIWHPGVIDTVMRGYLESDDVFNFLNSPKGLTALLQANISLPNDGSNLDRSKLNDYINGLASPRTFFANVLPQQLQLNFDGLGSFLLRIGLGPTDQSNVWATFSALSKDLQHVFADQVFFAELKAVGEAQTDTSGRYQRGYEAINTMFPADFGYTQNTLGGGTNGANLLKHTGDLDLLHATIQTKLGGDISIFGPGGAIRVGSLALEPNNLLKPNDLGILTLGVGDINTFTDASVLVNSSRVMTQQGGDILMWSSNGDLDAGRGAQTTLSFPPLQVVFNSDDYQSVDLGGLVSGAGIATLQSSKLARKSNALLLAPRGKVDAGEAGIRVSGNLTIAAVQVVNAGNIQVGGTATGIPTVTAPNIGALSAASNTAGAAAKSAEPPTASGNNDRASVFIVEVVGYGGSDNGGQDSSGNGQGTKPDDQERKQP